MDSTTGRKLFCLVSLSVQDNWKSKMIWSWGELFCLLPCRLDGPFPPIGCLFRWNWSHRALQRPGAQFVLCCWAVHTSLVREILTRPAGLWPDLALAWLPGEWRELCTAGTVTGRWILLGVYYTLKTQRGSCIYKKTLCCTDSESVDCLTSIQLT